MAAVDLYPGQGGDMGSPYQRGFAVTPDNSNDLAFVTRGIFVGTGGAALKVTLLDGTDLVFANVPSGTLLPIRATKVFATGTGCSNIVALY